MIDIRRTSRARDRAGIEARSLGDLAVDLELIGFPQIAERCRQFAAALNGLEDDLEAIVEDEIGRRI